MQILKLPKYLQGNVKAHLFANRLQFAADGQSLLLEVGFLEDDSDLDFQTKTMGRLDFATSEWEPLGDEDVYDGMGIEYPIRAWRQDFTCVASVIDWDFEDVPDEIRIDDPKCMDWQSDQYVSRMIEPNSEGTGVCKLAFSGDGRWLYGVEYSDRTKLMSLVRTDVQVLLSKPVIEEIRTNRLTQQSRPFRYVRSARWNRFATLPPGVRVWEMGISPDSRIVAAGSTEGDTYLFRVRAGQSLGVLKRKRLLGVRKEPLRKKRERATVRRLAFSPSGKQLGVVVDGMLRVWNVKSAELMWEAEDAKAHVIDLAYHPDGNTIALARSDGAALFLDAQTGAVRKRYAWKLGQLNSIAFSPDGLTCAAGGEKRQIVVWDVDA